MTDTIYMSLIAEELAFARECLPDMFAMPLIFVELNCVWMSA